jgi:hypothetical protein
MNMFFRILDKNFVKQYFREILFQFTFVRRKKTVVEWRERTQEEVTIA